MLPWVWEDSFQERQRGLLHAGVSLAKRRMPRPRQRCQEFQPQHHERHEEAVQSDSPVIANDIAPNELKQGSLRWPPR